MSRTENSGEAGSDSITNGAWLAPKNAGPPLLRKFGTEIYGGNAPFPPPTFDTIAPSAGWTLLSCLFRLKFPPTPGCTPVIITW